MESRPPKARLFTRLRLIISNGWEPYPDTGSRETEGGIPEVLGSDRVLPLIYLDTYRIKLAGSSLNGI